MRVLEVTLRTAARPGGDPRDGRASPDAIVGVGTLTQPEEFAAARDAGAVFGVSPGLTPALIEAAKDERPAAAAGRDDAVRSDGRARGRLPPAEAVPGGAGRRRRHAEALAGPLPDVTFCPTGGISIETAPQFLACRTWPAWAARG